MKKVLFFALFLWILGAANVNAQVTIGADEPPHPGAVLDLKSYSLGLKLPVVFLQNVNIFQLSDDGSDAKGMVVYNAYDATTDGRGAGLYVWDGSKWAFVGVSGPVQTPVTGIAVYSQGNATTVQSGSDLLFTAVVMPSNATNPLVAWSAIAGTGTGSIDPVSGLFTGGAPGTVTIRATATDGTGVYGEKTITVTPGTVPVTGITNITGGTSMQAPGTLQLSASVIPSDATNQLVVWSIVGGSGATVDENGLVTATSANGSPIVVRAAADECLNSCFKEASVSIASAIPAMDCDGCKALLNNLNVSLAVYPYYYYGQSEPYGYCIGRSLQTNSGYGANICWQRRADGDWERWACTAGMIHTDYKLCGAR